MIRRNKHAVHKAKQERELSEKRLKQTQKLVVEIQKIKNENHFADAIIEQLLQGYDA